MRKRLRACNDYVKSEDNRLCLSGICSPRTEFKANVCHLMQSITQSYYLVDHAVVKASMVLDPANFEHLHYAETVKYGMDNIELRCEFYSDSVKLDNIKRKNE